MNWREYFTGEGGKGFLATADGAGRVHLAVLERPFVVEGDLFVFAMTDRRTYANLRENPSAVYAFNESGLEGVRIFLEKVREEDRGPLFEQVRRWADRLPGPGGAPVVTHIVYFRLVSHLPLAG